ncbi:ferritin-like domain-containing protein [Annulohypoxylon maeteangense]|uniref:ferritin-like domain-containing protein n=1 Tax=Annulohypoxylon maeteangense TaxID=1927788 RepID=UPI002007F9C3|nr:ferritin-like domain-containing protein [Annulohypoxylon maeteangense]KAI0883219.1 ferritin-like domain-containing protein [Annulohypoxylon maeteangense]
MAVRSLFQACLLSPLVSVVSAGPALGKIGSFVQTQKLSDPNYGPKPGQDPLFSTYYGVEAPFPGNLRDAVLPTKTGPPGEDDQVWQNLLAAEWIIFDFYQKAVESFNATSFVAAGYPNTTYQRIQEIRNNEAGHLRIFQNQISPTSVKPGGCEYQYPFYDAVSFLALATVLEISSMAFLTGLVQQAKLPSSQGAMLAIAETEARHEVWSLIEIWKQNPFGGPADTTFPYANQILDSTNGYIVPGSCPLENPPFPNPRQNLPSLSAAKGTVSLTPGSNIALNFTNPENQPTFAKGKDYYAVFFHGVYNVSVPIDTKDWPEKEIYVTIPEQFETKGVIVAVVADAEGAPTEETVVAGPGVILEQPAALATKLL